MKTIILRQGTYEGRPIIRIEFGFDNELIRLTKKFPGVRWSPILKSWYIPEKQGNREKIAEHFKGKVRVDQSFSESTDHALKISKKAENAVSELSSDTLDEITEFEEWMKSRRYSDNTIRTYIDMLRVLFRFYYPMGADEITQNEIDIFIRNKIIKQNYSTSYQNQFVSSIKLFYKTRRNIKLDITKIQRPRRERKLPHILSREEVKKILNAHYNIKHRSILSLTYACGLRRCEVLMVKPSDLDSERGMLHVRKGKGKKDRMVPISGKILDLLREYYVAYKPKVYLFEGRTAGKPYTEKSLHSVLKQALRKCGIKKPVSLHWLRHSYATHLLESGTDIRYIQEILGHKSSRTTEIYTHVTLKNLQNIKSPFDDL